MSLLPRTAVSAIDKRVNEVHGSLGVILWNAAHKHLSRAETEEALNGLEASSLWLSSRIYQEARHSLDDMNLEL